MLIHTESQVRTCPVPEATLSVALPTWKTASPIPLIAVLLTPTTLPRVLRPRPNSLLTGLLLLLDAAEPAHVRQHACVTVSVKVEAVTASLMHRRET